MKTYHVLNGDCLLETFRQTTINQDYIICRECLIDGEILDENITDFWHTRATFMSDTYNVSREEYFMKTVHEFEKLNKLPDHSEVCLWFENDLFCQTNMWFVISILAINSTLKIFRIFPAIDNDNNIWEGFASANVNKLEQVYFSRVPFTLADIELGKNLWSAYQRNNYTQFKKLSKTRSNCFQDLEDVCQAHLDRFPQDKTLGRPDKVVKELLDNNTTSFDEMFRHFSEKEGIYGFGDLQFLQIYNRQLSKRQ